MTPLQRDAIEPMDREPTRRDTVTAAIGYAIALIAVLWVVGRCAWTLFERAL